MTKMLIDAASTITTLTNPFYTAAFAKSLIPDPHGGYFKFDFTVSISRFRFLVFNTLSSISQAQFPTVFGDLPIGIEGKKLSTWSRRCDLELKVVKAWLQKYYSSTSGGRLQ